MELTSIPWHRARTQGHLLLAEVLEAVAVVPPAVAVLVPAVVVLVVVALGGK